MLTEKRRGALVLCASDARAQALGLVPGMTLADAHARQPDLIVAPMDEAADQRWLDRLAKRCIHWSPRVTPLPPDGIVIDSTGTTHLFGGENGLHAQVADAMTGMGMAVRMAAASTAEAAMALARYAALPVSDEASAIRALPVAALGLDTEATTALQRAGLKSIGDVAVRPAAGIAARFGMAAVTALRRVLGEEHSPHEALSPPAPLHFERRFAEPIGHQNAVAACFLDLLQQAARAMAQRDLGGRRFCLTLLRSDGAQHKLTIETGLPTRDPPVVLRLFDERIAALADPLDPGFGYDSIRLAVPVTEPLAPSQPRLDGAEQSQAALAELIDRLSTQLGPGSLRRLAAHDSHLPEQAQLALPASQCRSAEPWPAPPVGEPPMRPIYLFNPPQLIHVIAEVPDGAPHRFRWRRKLHEVRLYEGPERIAAEWWQRADGHNGGGLTRDYYRIEDVRGRRYWIFRHGLYAEKPDPKQGPQWYLHGLFA